MKNLIIIFVIILSLYSCKKTKIEPKQEEIVVTPCNKTTEVFTGKYYTFTTSSDSFTVDTIKIDYIKNNCPTQNSNQYRINNLYNAMRHHKISIVDKDYIIDSSNEQNISTVGSNFIINGTAEMINNLKLVSNINNNSSVITISYNDNNTWKLLTFKKIPA